MIAGGRVAPLAASEFAAALDPLLETDDGIAIGVSGGADSMALLRLVAAWAAERRRHPRVVALTVDHGLRAASAKEARQVTAWCAAVGVEHRILRWRGPKPTSGLQAAARAARYDLLGAACRRLKIKTLAVAHNVDDQAETVLMRLGRGSGLDGLAGMADRRPLDNLGDVYLCRPLLRFPRARLVATLCALDQAWIEDPSNHEDRFQRVRVRQALRLLAPDDVVPERIAAAARHVARARDALETAAGALVVRAGGFGAAGSYALLDPDVVRRGGEEAACRALRAVLAAIAGHWVAPDSASIDLLWRELEAGSVPRRTLHGCLLTAWRGRLLLCRETRNPPAPRSLAPGRQWQAWDGMRVMLRLERGPTAILAPLGADGWRQLLAAKPEIARSVPRLGALAAPALWRKGRLIAAPWFDFRVPGAGLLSARLANSA